MWFDKDDLRPGGQWQPQIEQAIANATAFVVYVGSKGVMNWVEAEVRVALSRANTDKGFLFVPALAAESAGSNALPPFAKLYQGVRDRSGRARSWISSSRPSCRRIGTRGSSSSTSRSWA